MAGPPSVPEKAPIERRSSPRAVASFFPNAVNLWGNKVGDEGIRQLASSARRYNLSGLAVGYLVGEDGVRALASSPLIANLSHLMLQGDFGDEGVRALA